MSTSTLPETGRPAPENSRISPRSVLLWTAVALLGAVAWGVLALARGERISAVWLVVAALGSYAIAYRFGSAEYDIVVRSPGCVHEHGAVVMVDGVVQPDGAIRLVDDGERHQVVVQPTDGAGPAAPA